MLTEQTILDWVVKGFVAVLAWFGVDLHKRVRSLEEKTVKQEHMEKIIDELKSTMKEHRDETRLGFSEIRSILLKQPNE